MRPGKEVSAIVGAQGRRRRLTAGYVQVIFAVLELEFFF